MALTVSGGIPGREMLVFIVVPETGIPPCCGGGPPNMLEAIGADVGMPKGDWLVCGHEAYVGMLIGIC